MTVTHCLHTLNHHIHTLQGLVSTHNERNEWWVVSLPLRWNLPHWFHFWCHLKKTHKSLLDSIKTVYLSLKEFYLNFTGDMSPKYVRQIIRHIFCSIVSCSPKTPSNNRQGSMLCFIAFICLQVTGKSRSREGFTYSRRHGKVQITFDGQISIMNSIHV